MKASKASIRFFALFLLGCSIAEATKPNIIVIMTDDMGYSDLGCFGREIKTPHLDDLAAKGVRLSSFYNFGKCCPTRAGLLTARNLLLAERSRKPKIGGTHGGERGLIHVFRAVAETDPDRNIYSYTIHTRSADLKKRSGPEIIAPNYPSPGDTREAGGEEVWAGQHARTAIMRSDDLINWQPPGNLHLPALRSVPIALSGASRRNQTPGSFNIKTQTS